MTEVENKPLEVAPEKDTVAEQLAAAEVNNQEEQPTDSMANCEKCKKKSSVKDWMKKMAGHIKINSKGGKKGKLEAVANGKEEKPEEARKQEGEPSNGEAKHEGEHKEGEHSLPQSSQGEAKQE